MNDFFMWIQGLLSNNTGLGLRLAETLLVLVIIWLLRRWIVSLATTESTDPKARYLLNRNLAYISLFLAVVALGAIWLENSQQLATYLGLVSAGLAIALKDPLSNLFGWVFIVWRKPFRLGDRIQIGEQAGDVIDINLFKFVLMEIGNWVHADQSTGRIIHIPNAFIFQQALHNYTEEFDSLWNEVSVAITFESNWKKAKDLLQEIAARHTLSPETARQELERGQRHQQYYYFFNYLTPAVYTEVVKNGVQLTIRYLCRPRQRRNSEQKITEEILDAFHQDTEIQFAYPTRRNVVDRSSNQASPSKDPRDL